MHMPVSNADSQQQPNTTSLLLTRMSHLLQATLKRGAHSGALRDACKTAHTHTNMRCHTNVIDACMLPVPNCRKVSSTAKHQPEGSSWMQQLSGRLPTNLHNNLTPD